MTETRCGVVVVGSINLDVITQTSRIPAPGETVLSGELVYRAGGKGANQAVAAFRAGAPTRLIGAVGDDQVGTRLIRDLEEAGVSTKCLSMVPGATSGIAIIVVDGSDNTVTVSAGANRSLTTDNVADSLAVALADAAVLVLQGEIALDTAEYAASVAQRHGVCVVFNASPLGLAHTRPALLQSVLAQTDVLVVNETEAGELADCHGAPETVARELQQRGPDEVVMTLGSRGAVIADRTRTQHFRAFPVEGLDSTGAGDAFCGALAAELAAGQRIWEAIRVASAAGALATTKLGAQESSPHRSDIEQFLREVDALEPIE